MGLSKNITLTIKDYEIRLDKQIKFYENDTIDLCFSILEYGIEVKDGVSINKLMPIQALTAYMLIETPQGVDYAESTKIEDNKIVFNLGAKYSQFVGIGHMQIVIKDSDGCRVTLPEFEFEIKKSINSDWEKELYFLSTEDDSIIIDEFGKKIHMSKISDMPESENLSEESYTMIIDEEGNKKLKVRAIVDAVEDSLDTKFNAYADEISGDVERIEGEVNEISESLDNLESEVNELKEGNINIDLTNYATKTELSLKVDKVNGKSLISDSEIERLSTLKNYDDADIKNTLSSKADKSELHSHSNKSVLDGITSAKVTEWNNKSTFDSNYNSLTNKPTIPTKTSQLNNDSGFITSIPSEYVTETELNDKGYLTEHQDISGKADKTELHSHTNKTVLDGISSAKVTEWNNKSTFSGSYNDLTNKPTIPTLNGYATEQYVNEEIDKIDVTDQLTDYAKKSELHSHSNKSVLDGITSAKVTEWDSKSTFSGNYNNLTNKPTIPTKTSQLANDSGFITSIPSEYVTETELSSKGYLTSHQDISGKADKSTLTTHTNDTTSHITATERNTWNAKSNLALGTTSSTAYRGDYGNTAYTHSQTAHAPSNAQKNSDITKAEIEAKLTGNISSHTHSQYLTSHQDLSDYALKTEIPNKTSQLVNDNNFLTSIPSEYITETELNTAFEQFNPGSLQQIPLYANSIEECTDTTKCYVLPDGFIYAYKETTVEIEPEQPEDTDEYTNMFAVDGYNLNKRWSHSSKIYSDANGHVASGYIPVKVGDVVRIKLNNLTTLKLNYDYNRIHFFDSSNNYVSGHYDGGIDYLLKITDEGDNTFSFTVGYVCETVSDDSTNYLIDGANDITKMLIAFNIGKIVFDNEGMVLTDEDYINANIIVTVNEEIKEPVVVQPSKNLVDTATYYLNSRYNSSNVLKQTDAEIGYVAFDYINIEKGDILRFKSTTRGYHNLGGSLLLWGNYPRLRFFNADNQLVASGNTDATPIKDFFKCVDEGDNTTAVYVGYKADGTLYDDADQIAKTRFTIQPNENLVTLTETDMQNIKITINTPMSELDNVLPPEGNTQVVWQWSNTGHAFIPNENYDNLIADIKNITDEHSKDIVYLKAIVNSEDSTSGLSDSEKIARIKNWDMPIYENAPVFLLEQNKAGISQDELNNEKVYERYDTLMNSHSHYITREDCGMASDGTTPIYIYHFREPEPHINGGKGSEKKPVILVVSGVHPTERAGEYSMYYAMEEITTNPELADLKRNVHFIVMPIINPTGVTDSTWGVRNPDGIQVHYNFEVDFKYPTDSGYVELGNRNHGGETPLSIPETQYFDKIMRDYQKDLAIVMSCHNNDVDTIRGTDFIWCSCPTNFATNIGYRLADKMSLAWRQKHGSAFDEGVIWANQYALQKASEGSSLFNPTYIKERPEWDWRVGQAGLSGSGGTEYKQALKYGVQGINVEVCSRNMVMDKNWSETWSSNVMTWGCETYVNFFRIFMAVYDYKDKEQYYKK